MSHFKAKMGELTALPQTPSWNKGNLLLREVRGTGKGRGEEGGEGRGRGGEGRGRKGPHVYF